MKIAILFILSSASAATECGDLRREVSRLKAAGGVEEAHHSAQAKDVAAKLKVAQKRLESACAVRKVTIEALPLGYVAIAPGLASRTTFDPGESWKLSLTTRAGAASGVVFSEPAVVRLPPGTHWEADGKQAKGEGDLMIAVAMDAQLTVEEPKPGVGTWRIDVKSKPKLITARALRQCASGGSLGGLSQAACKELLEVDPLRGTVGALPDRGRAGYLGEWQFGGGTVIELGDDELGEMPESTIPPRLDLTLQLSAPIPGVSTDRSLQVSLEGNGQMGGAGAGLKLAEDCGSDAECDKKRVAAEIWYDRIFGAPFVRTPPKAAQGATDPGVVGHITDRLSRPVAGQRVLATIGGRRAVTMTDSDGAYRFSGLGSGDITIYPVGRKPTGRPRPDQQRLVGVGVAEVKVPPILVDRLFE